MILYPIAQPLLIVPAYSYNYLHYVIMSVEWQTRKFWVVVQAKMSNTIAWQTDRQRDGQPGAAPNAA